MRIATKSKSQTQKFAAKLAKHILRKGPGARASIWALSGDLGAGKTTFTQGFIKALGVKHHVTSPTFLIVRRYPLGGQRSNVSFGEGSASGGKGQMFKDVYHFDLYRIHDPKEILSLGFKKIISNSQNIVLIEWPERIGKLLPKNTIWVYFSHSKKLNERKIILSL